MFSFSFLDRHDGIGWITCACCTDSVDRIPHAGAHQGCRAFCHDTHRLCRGRASQRGSLTRYGYGWSMSDNVGARQTATICRPTSVQAILQAGLGGISKVFRTILQSAVLGVGAYLVIHQELTAGIIIASSILTSRALAPVELAIANWKGFVAARQGCAAASSTA